jgi:hypothetical protein
MVIIAAALAAPSGSSMFAQGEETSHVGDVFGDLIHIKRDPTTGQPILQKREVLLPEDVPGWAYCPIPVDVAGAEIPFLPQSCDPDPAYTNDMIEVDYFGRLSAGRTQERNLRMHFDETIAFIKDADVVTLEESGRLKLGTDCIAPDSCATWKTVDSPLQNMSVYRRLLKYGHIQTDPLDEDTSPGGDPNEGTVYHPALDASDWAKFAGPATALLPRALGSQCFAGTTFDLSCTAAQALTTVDFFLGGAFLAAAADKTGRITPDLVQYLNRILKITIATPDTAATLNTVPALIRDENGVIAPAAPGLPAPANERFVDFSPAGYLRADWFSKSMLLLQPSGGVYAPTVVNFLDWLNYINGPMTATVSTMPAFVSLSNDALRVVEFIHNYEIPADLWSGPAATITTVAPKTAASSPIDQNVALSATVTSQSPTPVSGNVTFSVRTAASVAVGLPVTAAVVNGTAAATYVLPGGTPPQVLTIAALFTPAGAFASSLGTGTLAVSPVVPGVDMVENGTFDNAATDWLQYAMPDSSYMVSNVTDGVFQFYMVPPPPGTIGQATVFQETGLALQAFAPLTAEFDFGNSSTARKRISVVLTEHDFSDRMLCTFWLPANTPLRTYRMRTHTNRVWTNAAIYFYAATAGSDGGYYQIDNVSLMEDPTGPTDATLCVDPNAPAPSGGAESAEFLTNGDFAAGLAPWTLFGQIAAQITAGVFEFLRPAEVPAGVVLQASGQPLANAAILTAGFEMGNSSSVRKRVTVMLHDGDFTDLAACMFWIEPGQPLAGYVMRGFTTEPWTTATLSIYPGTVDTQPWTLLDNVSLKQTPATAIVGTECVEPAANPLTAPLASAEAEAIGAAPMDASSPAWLATDGFLLSPQAAFGGEGLGWAAVASEAGRELLSWSRPVDLGNMPAAWLRFYSRLVSDASTATVEISDDGLTWRTLAAVPPTATWALVDVDLSAFAGRVVYLRFVLETAAPPEPTAPPDVWWIDGFEIAAGQRPPAG